MTTIRSLHAAVLTVALVPALAIAGERGMALMAPQSGDQIPERLVSAKALATVDVDRAPASFAWALDGSALAAPAPFVRESREYWFEADARALASGVAVRTTAPGAVLRLSPLDVAGKAAPAGIDVELSVGGKALSGDEAFASKATTAQLNATGASFAEGTAAFVLDGKLGAGEFTLRAPKADRGWLVHVYEPNSAEVLAFGADKATVLDGGEIAVTARLASGTGKALGHVGGMLVAPGTDPLELRFEAQADGTFVAKTRPDATRAAAQGLWELHAYATSADGSVRRDAVTAFNAVLPTARFAGEAAFDDGAKGGNVALRVAVDVGAASRFNASAVLYATDAKGALVPAAIAHGAAWLEPGGRTLTLSWPVESLISRGLGTPYEVRSLTLTDQGALGIVEKRERALRIER